MKTVGIGHSCPGAPVTSAYQAEIDNGRDEKANNLECAEMRPNIVEVSVNDQRQRQKNKAEDRDQKAVEDVRKKVRKKPKQHDC
ncbi:MAG: hypothetical protein WA324_25505 [Bryobacteraceae bacterium]